ncbi:MAG: AraC family transcriptional regulator [Spirosomataceae bacterium]
MKVSYEKIQPDEGSSFKVLHLKEGTDRFFWHYHPEYEIVCVRGGQGQRHVGSHISQFEDGDLVFIGPELPHSGFGHHAVGEHEEIVIQLPIHFLGESFMLSPELSDVRRLFERSQQGILFHGQTKKAVTEKLRRLVKLTHFERLLALLQVFQLLAKSNEFTLLNSSETRFEFGHKDEQRINRIYEYVEQNYRKPVNLHEVATEVAHLTIPAFCNYFKKIMHLTFTEFVNQYRIGLACKLLATPIPIADICYDTGFNNLSHFNKTFKSFKGKSPSAFRKELSNYV